MASSFSDGSFVGEFDEALVIYRHDGGRTGFDESFEAFLSLNSQAAVAEEFGYEKPAARECERLEGKANSGTFERAKTSLRTAQATPSNTMNQRGRNLAASMIGKR